MGNKLVKFDDSLFYKNLTLYNICIYLSSNSTLLLFYLKYVFLRQLSRSILSCLNKLCLLKSENDHEMSLSQTVDQTKVP